MDGCIIKTNRSRLAYKTIDDLMNYILINAGMHRHELYQHGAGYNEFYLCIDRDRSKKYRAYSIFKNSCILASLYISYGTGQPIKIEIHDEPEFLSLMLGNDQ